VTSARRVVIGVDTHLDTIHIAAITDTGQLLGDAEFATNPTGYWAPSPGLAASVTCSPSAWKAPAPTVRD
jgi:hypothetical protein